MSTIFEDIGSGIWFVVFEIKNGGEETLLAEKIAGKDRGEGRRPLIRTKSFFRRLRSGLSSGESKKPRAEPPPCKRVTKPLVDFDPSGICGIGDLASGPPQGDPDVVGENCGDCVLFVPRWKIV